MAERERTAQLDLLALAEPSGAQGAQRRTPRRGELVGPYFFRGPALIRNVEELAAKVGPNHPRVVTLRTQREYIRRVPPLVGCSFIKGLGDRAEHLGLCIRPKGHDGDCRFLVVSIADSAAIKARAASVLREPRSEATQERDPMNRQAGAPTPEPGNA